MALTDVDGNPLKAADADGSAVDCGVVDLGNGAELRYLRHRHRDRG